MVKNRNGRCILSFLLALVCVLPLFAACNGREIGTTGAVTSNVGTTIDKSTVGTTENGTTEHPTTENGSTENITTVNPTTENITTENITTENITTENITTENITTENITTENITTGEEIVLPLPPETPEQLWITDGQKALYTIISGSTLSPEMNSLVQWFSDELTAKTGVPFRCRVDSVSPDSEREIVIGGKQNRPDALALYDRTGYGEYRIETAGEQILMCAFVAEYYQKLFQEFLDALVSSPDGWYVEADAINYSRDIYRAANAPKFVTEFGKLDGGAAYFSMEKTVSVSYVGAKRSEFDAYVSTLEACGYQRYAENRIGSVEFYTYTKDRYAVHLQFSPATDTVTLQYTNGQFLPPQTAQSYTPVARSSATQLRRFGFGAWGLTMIFQLADGTFILYDGGKSYAQDRDNVLSFLMENKPAHHERPIISLWLFSHPHEDHVESFAYDASFFSQYVELRALGYNFPIEPCSELDATGRYFNEYYHHAIDAQRQKCFPDAKVWTAHTGQKFCVADAVIEVLYTHEDYYPNRITDANNCNTNYRITVEGATIVLLGDSDNGNAEMTRMYGSALEAEMVQASHHGGNGPAEMYQAIDAMVVFWPASAADTEERMEIRHNKPWALFPWTRTDDRGVQTESGERMHYTASKSATVYFDSFDGED